MASVEPLIATRRGARQPLPEEVASYVRELIMSGEIRPGEFIRMERIAEALGMSNTPVREGLVSLSSQGFVRMVPRRGFMVAHFSKQDVLDVFWGQAQIAGELAARAAKSISNEGVARLEELVERHEEAVVAGRDNETISAINHAFHREVNLAANSEQLALLLASIVRWFPNRFYADIEGQVQACRIEHPKIVEALKYHRSKQARTLMEQHIEQRGGQLVHMLEQRGVWREDVENTGFSRV
jgi:DNA-binding GntR family transcriptional regulator